MLNTNYYLLVRTQNIRRQEAMREAEKWRLLRQSGVRKQAWLTRQGCHLLCQLGRLLKRLGRHLEQYQPQQAAS